MFTAADLRNIAIQIEKNGEQTYLAAARAATSENVAEVLRWMAAEEKRHQQWFEALQLKEQPKTEEQEELEALGRGLLQDMIKDQTFSLDQKRLARTTQVKEVLLQSQDFEAETVLFYEFLVPLVEGEENLRQLQGIINEEKKHLERLTQLMQTFDADVNGVAVEDI